LSQHNIILSFPSPEEVPTLMYEGMAQMDLFSSHWCRVRTPRQPPSPKHVEGVRAAGALVSFETWRDLGEMTGIPY
jgi:hypothetical protein